MKKILFLLALLISALLNAQESPKRDCISLEKNRRFNLPIQGISIQMPAPIRIILPQFDEGHEFLQIDKNINIVLQPGYLDSRREFDFFASNSDASCMKLYMRRLNSFFANTYLEKIQTEQPTFEHIESIKNDLGTSISYRYIAKEKSIDNYLFYNERTVYHFEIASDVADKQVYEAVIKKIKKKSFKKELENFQK